MSESGISPRLSARAAPVLRAVAPAPSVTTAAPRRLVVIAPALLAACVVYAGSSMNPGLTLFAFATLALIVAFSFRRAAPPVFVLTLGMQWLQGSLMTFHANFLGLELWKMSYSRSIEQASYLSMTWTTVIALGTWLVLRTIPPQRAARHDGIELSMPRLLAVYVAWTLGMQVVIRLRPDSFAQIIGVLVQLRWAFIFAIFVTGWTTPRWRPVVFVVLGLEVAAGFLSFFSEFKTPLFVFALGAMTLGERLNFRRSVLLGIIVAVTLYFGIIWSAIKMDYRDRLTEGDGRGTQVISIGVEERAEAFLDLFGQVDQGRLTKGLEALVKRIAYVDYFAYALDYVPAVRDHENGERWLGALVHVLVPRALYPDKPPLESDTVITERYTGLALLAGTGTSIALGVPGETYVDVGAYAMFPFALVIGLVYGFGYRYFILKTRYGALAQGFATAVFVTNTTVGPAISKLLGGILMSIGVSIAVWLVMMPTMTAFLRARASSR